MFQYGFAPKGTSVILYSSQHLRHFQYFVQPDWPGGIYASPSMAGSRAGGETSAHIYLTSTPVRPWQAAGPEVRPLHTST